MDKNEQEPMYDIEGVAAIGGVFIRELALDVVRAYQEGWRDGLATSSSSKDWGDRTWQFSQSLQSLERFGLLERAMNDYREKGDARDR